MNTARREQLPSPSGIPQYKEPNKTMQLAFQPFTLKLSFDDKLSEFFNRINGLFQKNIKMADHFCDSRRDFQ